MARKCLPLLLALCLLLAACGPRQEAPQDDGTLDLVATTYPVYLFAAEVTRGAEDVTLTLMIDQPISCLHDYTLTVKDMKALERADGILLNGAGLEEAMECADLIGAKHTVPIHMKPGDLYDNDKAKAFTVKSALLVRPGEEISL